LIDLLIVSAQKFIDDYCRRSFEVITDTTRKFDVERDVSGDTLYFDQDICSITTVTNNADGGADSEVVDPTEYVTLPRNITPYHAIRILSSSDKFWTYTDDPENGITVEGGWAFSTMAPDDIKQACIRLAGYYYRQKDAQVFDVTADPMTGMITIPKGLPADVKMILDMYRKPI
jgi:hypothetical protein